jgi:hypothetical protein
MAATQREPRRFAHTKLLGPDSSWEFARWDRVDAVGFVVCLAVSGGILALFAYLLKAASGAG